MTTQDSYNLIKYLSPREGSNVWAQRADVIAAWKNRAQIAVPPLSMEYAPILACNADCPLCPYRRSRLQWCDGTVPALAAAPEDDVQSATGDSARQVLEAARTAGVQGVLFTGGGEPTIWEPLINALTQSAELGMQNALYTNGFRLGWEPAYARHLLAPENGLVFVRVSINAVTPAIVQRHWGVKASHVQAQFAGLAALLKARRQWLPHYHARGQRLPSIQISTILDRQNVSDLPLICETVAKTVEAQREVRGKEDVMVVRPLTIHGRQGGYSTHDHDESVIQEIIRVCGAQGQGRARLAGAGMPLFLGFGLAAIESSAAPSYAALLAQEYAQRDISWANGLFLTVGPDSSVYLNTETNCDRQWALGNLKSQSVAEIYQSPRRREVLEQMNACHWGARTAQPTSRTARLDRIAKAVMSGELSDTDIEMIRRASLNSHSLLLD